ncbi:hypothetical protein [Nocardia sp. No.11]|uniref:hypothetical protein n=1 Tax=Nocardia sp. No.11 TaxID=3128861 RepID=UPI00319E7AFC
MSSKEVAVFISARHFTGIAPGDRDPAEVLDHIESAAGALMLTSGIAHRVVVADCAQPDQRAIAEQFSIDSGFRVRHCPAAGADQSMVLSAEILEALSNAWVKTFVVGDDLVRQSATVDVLQRQRRWVIGLVGEYPIAPRLADMTYTMPLARHRLLDVVTTIIAELNNGSEEHTVQDIHRELQRRIAGFSAADYGFQGTADLVATAKGLTRPAPKPPRTRMVSPTPKQIKKTALKAGKKFDPHGILRAAILALTPLSPDELESMDDVGVGCRLLDLLTGQPHLRDALRGGGMINTTFAHGVRHLVGDKTWRPPQFDSFVEYLRQCTDRQGGWILACLPERPQQGIFLFTEELPDGWQYFAPITANDPALPNAEPSDAGPVIRTTEGIGAEQAVHEFPG